MMQNNNIENLHDDGELPEKYFDLSEYRLTLWQQLSQQLSENTGDVVTITSKQIDLIKQYEVYWAFPGLTVVEKISTYLVSNRFQKAQQLVNNVLTYLKKPRKKSFKPYTTTLDKLDQPIFEYIDDKKAKPYFELLVFHPNPTEYQPLYERVLSSLKTESDEFYYELVFVDNLADALCALLSNDNIQACLSVSNCNVLSEQSIANDFLSLSPALADLKDHANDGEEFTDDTTLPFLQVAKELRPELEHYYLAEVAFALLPSLYFNQFHRVFYHEAPFKDLHLHLLNGLRKRYNTPFYNALQAYSKKPKGVFHALPISRGSSIKNSVWLSDFYQFYGDNVFLAETSSTQGGMDSLLNPKGIIKQSQNKAASCFGAQQSYFVTNGTSTSNKIVIQATVQPGDIIFVSSDCHKSVPYGVMLSGAHAVFLQTNAVDDQDLYGAVSLSLIKTKLLTLKSAGLLHKVKAIILTNSTFDGLIYDVEHYMTEILAIKPDMIFHWDEAWFAHAHFNCLYQSRHAMSVASKLKQQLSSQSYIQHYQSLSETEKARQPDPDKVVIRVYATQSTHKTLSCFRQGSMIHVFDEQFNQDIFLEALYTHSSTSPNYQILGSLDIARRQMNIEGFALTQNSIRIGQYIRSEIAKDPDISKIFTVLSADDIYPDNKPKQATEKSNLSYLSMLSTFNDKGFVVDPTRVTVDIRKTGMQGHAFRQLLIDRYDIQINKTSEFTVLFIINIGASMETAHYLLNVLREIAEHILTLPSESTVNRLVPNEVTTSVSSSETITLSTKSCAEMPQIRQYHPIFIPSFINDTLENDVAVIDMRKAYYSAYLHENIEYIQLHSDIIDAAEQGATWVSAAFVTPYPPGFPMLVPGQIIDIKLLRYFASVLTHEVHGYQPDLGLKVFTNAYLSQPLENSSS